MHKVNILDSKNIKNIHFVGIGGISMSGLSEIMLNLGYKITGSDIKESSITRNLSNKGITVFIGHNSDHVIGSDFVVYTAAVKKDNPEFAYAISNNIPMLERKDLLGQIMKLYKNSINISGTHGKTTTTSMISRVMLDANMDPTIHIGGELQGIGSTYLGGQDYFITEACEYVNSFLKFSPTLAVILNIEADHLDFFKDIDEIIDSFKKFVALIPDDGHLIVCNDDENCRKVKEGAKCNVITYGFDIENSNWSAVDINFDKLGFPSYTLVKDGEKITTVKLNVMGQHNIKNSLAVFAICQILDINVEVVKKSLLNFFGPKRRFEIKGTIKDVKVIDDYAHHPTEIMATLNAVKNGNYNNVWCVFQPHTYTRTRELFSEFAKSFYDATQVIVTDIYAAREKDLGIIHSKDLVEKIQSESSNAIYMNDFDKIAEYLYSKINPGDIVITLGAGDVNEICNKLLNLK